MNYTIEDAASDNGEIVETALLKSLGKNLVQADNVHFVRVANAEDGHLLGGLTASTSYGWLLIKALWVEDAARGQGLGKALMADAESRGVSIGCHAVWLDTSNPSSKQFYERLGYEVFGELQNASGQFPESHHRWFMRKALL